MKGKTTEQILDNFHKRTQGKPKFHWNEKELAVKLSGDLMNEHTNLDIDKDSLVPFHRTLKNRKN